MPLLPTSARRGLAVTAVAALAVTALAVPTSSTASPSAARAVQTGADDRRWFDRVATYPVFQNAPEGVDPADGTVAEISTVTEDGETVIYTDAAGQRIGFLDISDPAAPVGDGSLDLTQLGDADDQPTSVAVVGEYVLVVVDESGGDFVNPSGRVDVVSLASREVVRSIDLGGQPDSIAVSPDGAYAAIAMENQRDEEATPPGGEEGDLPQAPPGSLQVLDLLSADPAGWEVTDVALTAADGTALPSFVAAGLDTPEDPEPEYVDIDDSNRVVLTLQENNGLVVVDLATKEIEQVFSAGNALVSNVDVTNDGRFNPYAAIDVPREPDAVQWVGDGLVATANEGDWKGGSRGWSVFDVATGEVVWDAGNSFENLALRHGLFNDDRADNKGAEPEGLAFAEMDGVPTAFVGSERSNFVAVYDMTDPTEPAFRQVLPATNGPEGLLPVPARDLLVVSSEEDDAEVQVRATVGLYELGAAGAKPAFPSIVSTTRAGASTPIGWGALGALSGDPTDPDTMYAASDAAFATGRIYTVDVSRTPAVITRAVDVRTAEGTLAPTDVEGLAARADGGFWLAVEGATGPANRLVRTDAAGRTQEVVELPAEVAEHVRNWGLEGVTVQGSGDDEQLVVALQRPLWVDPSVGAGSLEPLEGDVARLGRYDVATGEWTWFAYPLETTSTAGDWIGLSEVVTVDDDTVAVIERDKLAGTAAAVKRIYTVDLPAGSPDAVTPVTKDLAVDVLPAMQAQHGWTQEKLEGLGITADGAVLAVTDNDGLEDATGETQLHRLGALKSLFADAVATTTRLSVADDRVRRGTPVRAVVRVAPGFADGRVRLLKNGAAVRTLPVVDGVVRATLSLGPGRHTLRAVYLGDATSTASTSQTVRVTVVDSRGKGRR